MKHLDLICCGLALVFLAIATYYSGKGDSTQTAFYMGLSIIEYLAVIHLQLLGKK